MTVHAFATDSDVLVLGGGFAGVWAAIRAAELGASVTLVEKAVVARGGASTLSSGVTTGPLPDDDLDAWAREIVEHGDFMCDEGWTRQVLIGQVRRIEQLREWGVPFVEDEDGRVRQYLSRGMINVRGVQYPPKTAMEVLRNRAEALGVRMLNRQSVVDLLTTDGLMPTNGSVCGAVAIDAHSADVYVHRSKAVVLATGPVSLKGYNPVDNDTGDGLSLALRAGAEIADLEFAFSGTFNIVAREFRVLSLFNIGLGHGLRLINRRGERFMEQYDPVRLERSELPLVVAGFVRELIEGRGPVYMDLTHCDAAFWHNLQSARGRANAEVLFAAADVDPRTAPVVVEATRGYWSNGRIGPIIDRRGRTSVPGLYAAGAVAKNMASGTHGSAGLPTAFAMNSGYVAGEDAARAAAEMPPPDCDPHFEDQVRRARAPLGRRSGFGTDDAHRELVHLQGTVLDNFTLDREKLLARIERHASMREAFASLSAQDPHDLVKAHEIAGAYLWVGCVHEAMLRREESRGGFIVRRDFPMTDDFQWRFWHLARRAPDGTLSFSKRDFPREPGFAEPPPPRRYLDPVASVIRDATASATLADGADPAAGTHGIAHAEGLRA